MQERFNWQSWKDCDLEMGPRVRISPSPPIYKIRILGDCCLALAEFIPHRTCSGAGLGLGRNKDFIRIFEIQKQFLPAQTEVRTNLFEKIPTLFVIFLQSDNFGLFYGIYEFGGEFEPIIAPPSNFSNGKLK